MALIFPSPTHPARDRLIAAGLLQPAGTWRPKPCAVPLDDIGIAAAVREIWRTQGICGPKADRRVVRALMRVRGWA